MPVAERGGWTRASVLVLQHTALASSRARGRDLLDTFEIPRNLGGDSCRAHQAAGRHAGRGFEMGRRRRSVRRTMARVLP